MNTLSGEERETHINQCADDRSKWVVFTDDPVMAARLDKIAIGTPKGFGREYTLRADQIVIRKGKRVATDAQRAASREQMRRMRQRQALSQGAATEKNVGIESYSE